VVVVVLVVVLAVVAATVLVVVVVIVVVVVRLNLDSPFPAIHSLHKYNSVCFVFPGKCSILAVRNNHVRRHRENT